MKRFILPIFFLLLFIEILFIGCGSDTTIINNNNTVPDPPVLVSPPNGSIDSLLNAAFSWNASTGATSYKIQIASDSAFINIVRDTTISSTTYIYSGVLLLGRTYYWKVKGINNNGEGNFSSYWSFRTPNIVNGSIAGSWILIYSAGTLDICPGEQVVFPNNSGGTAELTCPGETTIYRQYSVNAGILTYTASGVKYHVSFTSDDLLVLTGINNNRILYYAHSISDRKSESHTTKNSKNSNSVNSSD